ncbi:MAG: D-arabinono-1,4-lactone oxidase [Nakamurella sp.]
MSSLSTATSPQVNWAGNYTYRAPRWHRPTTVGELQGIVADSERAKALGSRHCFNDIADTPGDLIDLTALPDDLEVNRAAGTVTVSAAIRYGRLAPELQAVGLSLANLASLPHISIAGAVATGTHGSGVGNHGLASAVSGFELVKGDGELVSLTRDALEFNGAVVGLGALGILTRVTLDVQPTFDVRQDVFENLPWAELESNFDAIVSAAYSVSLFTDWQGPGVRQVWCKSKLTDSATGERDSLVFDSAGRVQSSLFGAAPASIARHPLVGLPGDVCTPQLGVPGPWFERLPHFQLAFTPSNGNEVQTEYLVPREHALDVVGILRANADHFAPLLQVSEVRTVAADELWLSPAHQRDSVAFHFTWINDEQAVMAALTDIEQAIAECLPRPHWGKLFGFDAAALAAAYPRLTEFRSLADRFDPAGTFRNDFLDRKVFG